MSSYPRVATFKTVEAFRERLTELGLSIECDDQIETAPDSPMAKPLDVDGFRVGNRWVIHPMEGWDAETDGHPSYLVRRRWRRFGISGAKWIWGGEAMAVLPEARANPNQLIISEDTRDSLARLHQELLDAHRKAFGTTDDLLVGFQLTHSGRFCKPFRNDRPEPKILYHHPLLDRKFHIPEDYPVLSDDEIRRIIERYIAGGRIAESCGAAFVDVKHCHGYLGHEFLSAYTRPGPYGGSFENRTRFLREIVEGIRAETTNLKIGVRLSAFDFAPFHPDPDRSEGKKLGPGIPDDFSGCLPYDYGFGTDKSEPVRYQLGETERFVESLRELDIRMLNVSGGSPYYNPHIQRPALFPPSDGYQPPEDPLVGCADKSRSQQRSRNASPRWRSWVRPTRICKSTWPTWRSGRSARAEPIPWGWDVWSSPTQPCPATHWRRASWTASTSAAPSATAPPARARDSCRGASRSTRSTGTCPRLGNSRSSRPSFGRGVPTLASGKPGWPGFCVLYSIEHSKPLPPSGLAKLVVETNKLQRRIFPINR